MTAATLRKTPDSINVDARVAAIDWPRVATDLDGYGWALFPRLVTAEECERLAGFYDDEALFRSRIAMARHGFGRGEYKYFAHPPS